MSINSRTIDKILREHFTGETPISKNVYEHQAFISSLKTKLDQIKDVEISHHYSSSMDKDSEQLCHFSINNKLSKYGYDSVSFTLKFNSDNALIIKHYQDIALVYKLEQIYSFIEKLKIEYENKEARSLKTKKIKKLKQQAITAKIKEIAKEDQFDFYIQEYQIKLKLIVPIEKGKIVEIDIPYNQFQNILKDLRSLIKTLRELQKSGITFRLRASSKYTYYDWITHNSL